ncbi:MAG: glycosyltransferase family 39 protein, partial [Anaerolineae bacterium]|nr:glycosyltransferase family 39 protein [Anaerolineae bacterium]
MSEGMDNPWRRVVRVWLPLLLLLLAFGLRLVRLDAFRLWGDEGWSMSVTTLDPASLLVEVGHDIHPPLYYYMAHLWGQVAGWGVFASRFFSVFPGTLLVALTAALGRRFGGTRIGWTGAALLAVAPFAVYYSQEVRPFAWMALWCVSALYLLLRVVHPRTDAGTRSAVTPLAHGHCEPAPFPAKQSP